MSSRTFSLLLGSKTSKQASCMTLLRPQISSRLSYQTRISPSPRFYATETSQKSNDSSATSSASQSTSGSRSASTSTSSTSSTSTQDTHPEWDENPNLNISQFSELPSRYFGANQHMIINEEFKEALRQVLWKFRAPIRYAFAYGSGVFPQSAADAVGDGKRLHSAPPEAVEKIQGGNQKMIDFIFGVSYTQHWHSLNIQEHRDHYSGLAGLGSYAVSQVQDRWGAGVYFNPYVTVNGTLIKYGVVNLDTLCRDLSEWDTMYIAGRLQKPVKILRDHPSVRLANQVNLLSAVRAALLLLPSDFTEQQLYSTITGMSYMGDPRMSFGSEDPGKIDNIVKHQMGNFRRLYAPLIDTLPNVSFNDSRTSNSEWTDDESINVKLAQDMDPVKRGNMVRRLPKSFREKLYFRYQSKYQIPRAEFNKMMEGARDEDPSGIKRRQGGPFERKIAADEDLKTEVAASIHKTIAWPSSMQSIKGLFTSGVPRSVRYMKEKNEKYRNAKAKKAEEKKTE